jgi:hypothetical protein
MNTILLTNKIANLVEQNVISTNLDVKDCKSFAGKEFYHNPIVTSASVVDEDGNQVLLLQKDKETLKCTERISK